MVADMDYFRLVRRTDPSYTAYSAFKEWMRTNRDTAVELAEQIWPEVDPNGYPMNWDDLSDCFRAMDPMDVFFEGYYSYPNCDSGDEYFIVEGDGHFSSMNYDGFEDACVDFMCNHGYRAILNGEYPAPKELAEVLALWGTTVRTENRRPTPRCKGGSCGKPVAKKVPTKKTGSANTKSKSTKSASTKAKSVKSKAPAKRCRA